MLKIGLIIMLLTSFNTFQDKRQLLIFTDNADNSYLKEQQKILNADPKGIKDRDIEVRVFYLNRDKAKFEEKNIKGTFTVILVGKDGGDKMRTSKPIVLQKLYSTIDAMPMRKSEMKQHP